MTDIDALVQRLRDERHLMQGDGLSALIATASAAADALTVERAKVAALEVEAARWREVAGMLEDVLTDYFCDDLAPSKKATRASAALTTYQATRAPMGSGGQFSTGGMG